MSKELGEPEWLLSWREAQYAYANTLVQKEHYGIGITALESAEPSDYASQAEYHVDASKGLELYTWKEAIGQEEITPFLERLMTSELMPPARSREAGLGRAQFHNGLVVYVQPTLDDDGTPKEETLDLSTTLALGSSSDMVFVIAKEGSRLKLTSTIQEGEASSVFARTLVVLCETGSRVDVVSLTTPTTRGFATIENIALTPAHASCNWHEDPRSAMRYRSHTSSILLGEGATSEIVHTLLASGAASYDVYAEAIHRASETRSRVYALGLGADTSKIVYRGNIDMKKGLHTVDGSQEGKFLILSKTAEVDAIPILDIASKDVISSHKLSVSHIRDIDLFYAKTRGIGEDEAREIALEGFFGSLLHHMKKDTLMEELRGRISALAAITPQV